LAIALRAVPEGQSPAQAGPVDHCLFWEWAITLYSLTKTYAVLPLMPVVDRALFTALLKNMLTRSAQSPLSYNWLYTDERGFVFSP
jgi:hypothetical protein